jgi:hypothetical protein
MLKLTGLGLITHSKCLSYSFDSSVAASDAARMLGGLALSEYYYYYYSDLNPLSEDRLS